MMELALTIEDPGWRRQVPDIESRCRRCAGAVAARTGRKGEVSLVLADDALLRTLNREYRQIDEPTNVLSFPQVPGEHRGAPEVLLGDVVVSLDSAGREAAAGAALADHVSHLIVHGILHLLGYDHEEEAAAEAMESLETAILSDMNIADPYRLAPAET